MTDRKIPALITALVDLARQGDRASLAALRRGLGRAPGVVVAMAPIVERYVPRSAGRADREAHYMVAALFASLPDYRPDRTFARAFRAACTASGSVSMEHRFRAVLDAEREDLSHHLRHLVSLLGAHGQGIDWGLLLADLSFWDHPDRIVQTRWARDFWGGGEDVEPESDSTRNTPIPVTLV